ncbi:MAG: SDR family NAD(P)-dependent oxidoreductase [Deltaproteobacteria bacterium]|nr:SDR family NAD(P)-dependent oxidoreductase [Deltaproteobacteria bacterium]
MTNSTRVFITGASSGIGREVARQMAMPGMVFGLVARRLPQLENLKTELERSGARVFLFPVDVTDAQAMGQAARAFLKEAGGIDIVLASAGLSCADKIQLGDPLEASRLIAANVQGVIHTLVPFIPAMIQQRSGHLAAMGSMAGYRGLPDKGAYCASKAAVKTLMDAYRAHLRGTGVMVTTLTPSWIESEQTGLNAHKMPFLVPLPKAASRIIRAIRKNKKTYIFPWQALWIGLPLVRFLPDRLLPHYKKKN